MSVQATSWVWACAEVHGTDLLLMLAIADGANREGEASCQSVSTLAEMTRTSTATIHRSLARLREAGLIEKTGVSERYKTSVYRLPGMAATPLTGETSQIETPLIQDARPLSTVRDNPSTTTPTTTPTLTSEGTLTKATGAIPPEIEPETHTSRPITHWWAPRPVFARAMMHKYPDLDYRAAQTRFVNHYVARGQSSRSWEALLENWLSSDYDRMKDREGTDDLGIPKGQRKSTQRVPQPGDPDYFDGGAYLDQIREQKG